MKTLLNHVSQYCTLGDSAQNALVQVLKKREFSKGEFLATEGKVCHHVFFLESGCVRGFYQLDGKEISYWFGFENNFVTSFYSFIARKPGAENIQCLEDCTTWSLSYDQLQQLYSFHPDLERLGRIMLERYYAMLEERFLSIHFKEARERYEELIAHRPHILQRIPLGYVASYLGISQETLSRIRSRS